MFQSIMDDVEAVRDNGARIKVIGVGGGGGNAVQYMINSEFKGVEFICANTDMQALRKNNAPYKIQLGEKLTKGRGAGANPKVGHEAALESVNAIRDAIGDAEMVFVTAGMGGGTGTGAASVIAQTAQDLGALTVGVVTKPFSFEGKPRKVAAETGLGELKEHVDCLIIIPNDRLIAFAPKKASFVDMLQQANNVLYHAVKGISDVIIAEGLINLDFADVRTIMANSGMALMGTGIASGENRAREAAQRAITSPLLEDVSLDSAKAILYNITAPSDIAGSEISEIGEIIAQTAPQDTNIIFGVVFDDNKPDDIRLTLVATGIEQTTAVEEDPYLSTDNRFKRGNTLPLNNSNLRGNMQPTQSRIIQPRQKQIVTPLQPSFRKEMWPEESSNLYEEKAHVYKPASGGHAPGSDDFVFEGEDLNGMNNVDIPTFIRKQAN